LQSGSVGIRACAPGELQAILALQRTCPEAAQWEESDYSQLIAEPGGMLLVAAEDCASQRDKRSTGNGWLARESLVGFCALRRVLDEAELRNLAVIPEHRRRGIAKALLEQSRRRLRAAGVVRVYLEVRPSNTAARNLYFGLGYRVQSVRKEYYREPVEDAEIMWLELNPEE
jgi:[ribosomal protein S18]-alanine N-acetyltransferase